MNTETVSAQPKHASATLNAQLAFPDENGHYDFSSERAAVREFMVSTVNENCTFFHDLTERLKYLIANGYYKPEVIEMYPPEDLQRFRDVVYGYKFRFTTLCGASKFYVGYAMKTTDGSRYLERFEDRVMIIAMELANGDTQLCLDYIDIMMTQVYQPATPTFANAGKLRGGELVSCYLINVEDNIESIQRAVASVALLSKRGGGVALCGTDIRAAGAPIQGIANRTSGLIPFAKQAETSASYANQLGTREGACVLYSHMCHMDSPDLIDTKRENADESVRLKTLSIGLVVPDIAYKLAAQDKPLYLFCPYDIMRIYGIPMSKLNITKHYRELVKNPNIRKTKINARRYFQNISFLQGQSGFPFIMNEDTVNRLNPLDGWISMSNLCVAPETMLTTRTGTFPISSLEGQTVDVWNGLEWSTTQVVKTGVDQHVQTVTIINAAGETRSLDCTDFHKWYITVDSVDVVVRTNQLTPGMSMIFSTPDTPAEAWSVLSVRDNRRLTDTYCVSEPIRNRATFNDIVTGNCTEILQPSSGSVYDAALNYVTTGIDISCNLGSLNAYHMLKQGYRIGWVINRAVRMLTQVSLSSKLDCVPSIAHGNDQGHAVGLGVMNLHGLFGSLRIHYGSPESLELTELLYVALRYHAIKASSQIAEERGETFRTFKTSGYCRQEGESVARVFKPYVERDWSKMSGLMESIFQNHKFEIPSAADWAELEERVQKYGMFNQNLMATAPTGSISYINNSTASIAPIVHQIESRKEGLLGRVYYPAPHMDNTNLEYFKDAYEVGYKAIIDVYAAASPHTCQGLSCTLYFKLSDGLTTRDLDRARIYAWEKGLKTLYYMRVRSGDVDDLSSVGQNIKECEACAV